MGLKDGTKVNGNGLATNVVTSTTYLAGRKGGYRVGNGWGWCRVVGLCCGVKLWITFYQRTKKHDT